MRAPIQLQYIFSYTILANPEVEPHAPNTYQWKLVPSDSIKEIWYLILSIHFILAGKVDLIKLSKYKGARDWLQAQDLVYSHFSFFFLNVCYTVIVAWSWSWSSYHITPWQQISDVGLIGTNSLWAHIINHFFIKEHFAAVRLITNKLNQINHLPVPHHDTGCFDSMTSEIWHGA